jgi:hypothetical protein
MELCLFYCLFKLISMAMYLVFVADVKTNADVWASERGCASDVVLQWEYSHQPICSPATMTNLRVDDEYDVLDSASNESE